MPMTLEQEMCDFIAFVIKMYMSYEENQASFCC